MDNLVELWIHFSVCEAVIVKDCTGTACDLTAIYSPKDFWRNVVLSYFPDLSLEGSNDCPISFTFLFLFSLPCRRFLQCVYLTFPVMRVTNHKQIFTIFFVYARWYCFLMKHFQKIKTCLYRTLLFMYMELPGWVVSTLPLCYREPRSNLGPVSGYSEENFPTCPYFPQATTSILP